MNKSMEELIRKELEESIGSRVKELVKKREKKALRYMEEFANSPKFEKMLEKAVHMQIGYFLDNQNIEDILDRKDSVKFWKKVSKRLLRMYK